MQKNEVVEKSKDIIKLLMYTDNRALTVDEHLAIAEAIKAVELLPELVEALEKILKGMCDDCEDEEIDIPNGIRCSNAKEKGCYMVAVNELLKKAKGEDE